MRRRKKETHRFRWEAKKTNNKVRLKESYWMQKENNGSKEQINTEDDAGI